PVLPDLLDHGRPPVGNAVRRAVRARDQAEARGFTERSVTMFTGPSGTSGSQSRHVGARPLDDVPSGRAIHMLALPGAEPCANSVMPPDGESTHPRPLTGPPAIRKVSGNGSFKWALRGSLGETMEKEPTTTAPSPGSGEGFLMPARGATSGTRGLSGAPCFSGSRSSVGWSRSDRSTR